MKKRINIKGWELRIYLDLPLWHEWRKFRFIKVINEAETYTNAVIGYKIWNGKLKRVGIYLPPLLFKFENNER